MKRVIMVRPLNFEFSGKTRDEQGISNYAGGGRRNTFRGMRFT